MSLGAFIRICHSLRKPLLFTVFLVATAFSKAPASESDGLCNLIQNARRIVCLGDSITFGGAWVTSFAAWMEYEGMTGEVINMGLSSETVSGLTEDGHAGGKFPRPHLEERLDRVLRVSRPDLVFACYGMNCGIYLPLDTVRFSHFQDGMQKLHETVEKTGATIIHLTPPIYDQRPDKPGPARDVAYDNVLEAMSKWLISKRKDGWLVIDVHGPMKKMLLDARSKDPSVIFAPDTVHPNALGSWAFCRALLMGLGAPTASSVVFPEELQPFIPLTRKRMQLLRNAYVSAAGHLRPGVQQGLPLGDAEAEARKITESIRSRRWHLMGQQRQNGVEWINPIMWPSPPIVDAGPENTSRLAPPDDAIILFDGTNLDAWENGTSWTVADGIATTGKGDIRTKQHFGDCQLHLEFREPFPAVGKGQGRGNSGVFFMNTYEIQILDSYQDGTDGPITYYDGQCGALYKQQPPAVNACRQPGKWQSFDILFSRPHFHGDGSLIKPARISVLHNGVAIHSDIEIKGGTFYHAPPQYTKHSEALPIRLQDHGDPVQFRNIWIRPLEPLRPTLLK